MVDPVRMTSLAFFLETKPTDAGWVGFLQKALLVLITAALSGFVIPYVLKKIEHERTIADQEREAHRARQNSIIQAGADFLERFTEKLWSWRYMAIRVTYYGASGPPEQYQVASESYSEHFWNALNEIRVELSRAERILSPAVHAKVKEFYTVIVQVDHDLRSASRKSGPQRDGVYTNLNDYLFGKVSTQIDTLLHTIAVDLQLDGSGRAQEDFKQEHDQETSAVTRTPAFQEASETKESSGDSEMEDE